MVFELKYKPSKYPIYEIQYMKYLFTSIRANVNLQEQVASLVEENISATGTSEVCLFKLFFVELFYT